MPIHVRNERATRARLSELVKRGAPKENYFDPPTDPNLEGDVKKAFAIAWCGADASGTFFLMGVDHACWNAQSYGLVNDICEGCLDEIDQALAFYRRAENETNERDEGAATSAPSMLTDPAPVVLDPVLNHFALNLARNLEEQLTTWETSPSTSTAVMGPWVRHAVMTVVNGLRTVAGIPSQIDRTVLMTLTVAQLLVHLGMSRNDKYARKAIVDGEVMIDGILVTDPETAFTSAFGETLIIRRGPISTLLRVR